MYRNHEFSRAKHQKNTGLKGIFAGIYGRKPGHHPTHLIAQYLGVNVSELIKRFKKLATSFQVFSLTSYSGIAFLFPLLLILKILFLLKRLSSFLRF